MNATLLKALVALVPVIALVIWSGITSSAPSPCQT
ncbi:unnamed protein product [uncultured bacterium]|nr:unnamed protein product [uncultured bacterium]